MSIRVTVLTLIVLGLSIYAWRNWFRALCGAIVLMAFLEHPDMPRSIFGIEGLNLWNFLLANVVLGWLHWKNSSGINPDMPSSLRWGFVLYIAVVVCACLRLLIDPSVYYEFGRARIIVDYLLNPFRFLIPCFLFYSGCRTRENVVWALGAILTTYLLLSLQVVRYVGLQFDLSGDALSRRAAKLINHGIGYNRVDMSMMLAGASWAAVAFSSYFERRAVRLLLWGVAGFILLAQAMTGGRTGYVTWGLVGLLLCFAKWRKLLPLIPLAAVIVILFLPVVRERMLEGFGGRQGDFVEQTDSSEVTSGRTLIWPSVIEKIRQRPLLGYGRLAMVRTGLADWAQAELHDDFGHPHNAYLEMLLDNGIVGLVCVMSLYWMILRRSTSLFVDRSDSIFEAAGGVALALLLALFFAGFGAQTFYPREGVVEMWAAIGVALRVWVEREWFHATGENRLASSDENRPVLDAEFLSERLETSQ